MAPTTMKAQHNAAVVTIPGFEDIAAAEVSELIGVKAAKTAAGMVNFTAQSFSDLCRLCYLSQSANSVFFDGRKISLLGPGSREYNVFGDPGGVSSCLAYLLLRASGYSGRQSIFDPFTRSGSIAIEAALFSSGFPVNHYRKDSLVAAFSKLPQFSKADFREFFAAAGKEAAAAAKKRVKSPKPKILSSSSSMQNVRFAEKNAKIAGVNKLIRFSRLDIEWLDAKLDERSIDLVVSYPPQFRGGNNDFAAAENAKLSKLYKNFFYQANFFLKKKGKIVLLLKKGSYAELTAAAAAYKFAARLLRSFKLSGEEFELVSFAE
ncbi:RNA methyltransferase [Candidatus Woesearchaeota archaeon]|nr:RNA methyltransferase [Candidatus Woesearchaeota archaeon]